MKAKSYELVHELPGDSTPLAATADHPPPELAHSKRKLRRLAMLPGTA